MTCRGALRVTEGTSTARKPGVRWYGGFLFRILRGTKAEELADWGLKAGRQVVRFVHSGHGENGARFEDGTSSRWAEEALAEVLEYYAEGPQIMRGRLLDRRLDLAIDGEGAEGRRGKQKLSAALVLVPLTPGFLPKTREWKPVARGCHHHRDHRGTVSRAPLAMLLLRRGRVLAG